MRILFVNAIGFVGGAEKWIVHLTRRLAPRGHEIQVAYDPRSPLGDLAREAGAEAWVPEGAFRGAIRSAWSSPRRSAGARLTSSSRRPCSTSRSPVLPRGWRRWRRRAPQQRLESPRADRELGVALAPPPLVSPALVQLAATNSQAGRADLVARDYLPPERIVPIYNGVDFSRFDPEHVERGAFRAELGIPRDAPLIVSISRWWRKGQEFEVEAAGRLTAARPDLHVAFLGPCRERERPYRERLARASLFPARDGSISSRGTTSRA